MEKVIKGFQEILLFPVIFLYYEICFKIFGGIDAGNFLIMTFQVLAAGGIVQAVYLLIPAKKVRNKYTGIILLTTAILFIAECFVGQAFQVFMTPESLFTGAGDVAGDFSNVVVRIIILGWYVILLYLLPFILFLLLGRQFSLNRKCRLKSAGVVMVVSIICLLGSHAAAMHEPAYTDEYQFDAAIRKFGLLTTLRLETQLGLTGDTENGDFIMVEASDQEKSGDKEQPGNSSDENSGAKETETETPAETEPEYEANTMDIDFNGLASSASDSSIQNLDKYLASQTGSLQNEYTGLFKGKNLILITAEAFSHHAVSPELTPTLYRMMHNGIYFSDYYQPAWGGSTSTGEYSVLMGLIPTEGVKSIRKTEGHNLYLSIGNQLSRAGYFSAAYHNNSYTYYGRNKTHINFGYSTFMGQGNGMEEGVKNCWPQSDQEMFNFTVSKYMDQQPFSVYYMTVSGHCGYSRTGNSMSNKNWEAVEHLDCSNTIKAYLASQLELEYALTDLVQQLQAAGILDDTVICLTSDHYPYGLEEGETWGNDKNYLPELYGCSESELNQFVQDRNGWILWSGCLENELSDYAAEISEPTYSLDILPTLSNLFGVEYDSRLLVGRDVFSDQTALVIWPNYSWKTDKAIYNAKTGKVTSLTGAEVSDSYVKDIKNIVKNKFNLSKITLNYDYWNHVFGD